MYYGIICLGFVWCSFNFCCLSALGQKVLFKQLLNAFYSYLTLWRFEVIAAIISNAAISSNVANIEVKKTRLIYKDFTLQFNRVLIQNEKKVGIQPQKTNQIVYLGSYKIYKIKNKNKRAFLHWLTLCFLCHNYLWQASAICQWYSKYEIC